MMVTHVYTAMTHGGWRLDKNKHIVREQCSGLIGVLSVHVPLSRVCVRVCALAYVHACVPRCLLDGVPTWRSLNLCLPPRLYVCLSPDLSCLFAFRLPTHLLLTCPPLCLPVESECVCLHPHLLAWRPVFVCASACVAACVSMWYLLVGLRFCLPTCSLAQLPACLLAAQVLVCRPARLALPSCLPAPLSVRRARCPSAYWLAASVPCHPCLRALCTLVPCGPFAIYVSAGR